MISDAVTTMPFTGGLTREECRLVSCPTCGAESTYKCQFPHTNDASKYRPKERIHKRRLEKAVQMRLEHRI